MKELCCLSVADMEVDMVADMEVDMLVDIERDKKAKFATNASGATCKPNLQLMQVANFTISTKFHN